MTVVFLNGIGFMISGPMEKIFPWVLFLKLFFETGILKILYIFIDKTKDKNIFLRFIKSALW